ncbi:hypothetical protein PLICRDRAFT_121316 [Plicaturopsis crispa FD-325 SS-3]|nr:hypothetical protein PLICRDRAFT_121316 [Plicaturopsis crispa FD-325 SS-3]
MRVWLVTYDAAEIDEDLYQQGLLLVDADSQSRVKKFYRREDACRCLIGRLLPRMLLSEQSVPPRTVTFGYTEAKKPYFTTPDIQPPIAFNVSHDNGLVAMAFAPGKHGAPSYEIGVDVMKVRLPPREPFINFVRTVGDQLTAVEKRVLLGVPQAEGLRRFYWIWTMKEAYTKALGLGLGFDFRRIEYNVPEEIVTIDGQVPKGWTFVKFELVVDGDSYVGVAAEHLGGNDAALTGW